MCESWARVEPVDRSKRLSTFHATPSMSSKAVMKDGKPWPRNQSTTRNHTSSSFRVQPTLPVPPSRPWTRRALPNPLLASRNTNYVDCTTNCTTTVPASSRDKIAKTSTAISSTLFRGRAWRNDCRSARQRPSAQTACRQGHCITVAPSLNHLCLRCQEHIHPATLTEWACRRTSWSTESPGKCKRPNCIVVR